MDANTTTFLEQLTTIHPASISRSLVLSRFPPQTCICSPPRPLAGIRHSSNLQPSLSKDQTRPVFQLTWDVCPSKEHSYLGCFQSLETSCHGNYYVYRSVIHDDLWQRLLRLWLRRCTKQLRSRLGHPPLFDCRRSRVFGRPVACFPPLPLPPQQNLVRCLVHHAQR
jgi:hypothetical protein